MKKQHVWVLGILLLAVVLLAFLGFFKSREGFQSAGQSAQPAWITSTAQTVPNVSLTGYDMTNISITNATFVERVNTTTIENEVQRSTSLESDRSTFILAILDGRRLKMVPLTFTKDTATGAVSVRYGSSQAGYYEYPASATIPTALTDSEIRLRWTGTKTEVELLSGNAGTGYGIKGLQVSIVRSSGSGSSSGSSSGASTGATASVNLSDVIRCPPAYTFFNGPNGDSMCCKGKVNPYTHRCEGADEVRNNICALSATVPDPRALFKGDMLPNCRSLVTQQLNAGSTNTCPASLPNFAKESETAEKCCKNPVQIAGETGFSCSAEDLKSTENYCVAKGVPKINPTDSKTERMCNETRMLDAAACPVDATGKTVFQNVTYTMGDREAKRYDIADLKGLALPTCYRLNEVCIPESVITYAKARGAFTEYDPKTWEYSCAVWSRKNRGEIVPGTVKGYLTVPQGGSSASTSTS